MTHKQLFQYQTVGELAAVATFAPADEADQGPVTGNVPLTPIQRWWFAQDLAVAHHYNQTMLLAGPPDFDERLAEQAVAHLLVHHDALRLRFTPTPDGWQQHIPATDEASASYFAVVDLADLPADEHSAAITAHASERQDGLDIEHGPLVQVVVFRLGANRNYRVLFIIHHLAVDAISWRVLLDDFALVYQQLQRNAAPQLPAKTSSFKQWAEGLVAYAQSDPLAKEAPFWLAQEQSLPALPVDHTAPATANTEGAAQSVAVMLDETETRDLLQEVPKPYHTQINDALLAALAFAFREWTGRSQLRIDVEGHGRESILDRVDLSRTVGWFTAIYPIILDITGVNDAGSALPAIKEQLRQIPQHGVGYGLLRHLNSQSTLNTQATPSPAPEVTFNYLGQFAADTSATGLFVSARESVGPEISPANRRAHLLEILGSVTNGQLHFIFVYCPSFHDPATISTLAQHFTTALRAIIAHCKSPEAGGVTPSDFPMINAHALGKYAALLDEEDNA
ncbi:MAG: hypothetical protein H0X24_16755 [Ktedonobacterales bacterium]|nr:hypothetical protein [Ktedonobacterales bacterium]